jgi:hypothetical protein
LTTTAATAIRAAGLRQIASGPDWMSGGPIQFQQQHLFIPHPSRAAEYRFDSGVDRFDDREPYGMIAVGGDALDMSEEEVPQAFISGKRCQSVLRMLCRRFRKIAHRTVNVGGA